MHRSRRGALPCLPTAFSIACCSSRCSRCCCLPAWCGAPSRSWARPHAPAPRETGSVEWPASGKGKPLRPLALSEVEQRFARAISRHAGAHDRRPSRCWCCAQVHRPTRMLHPAADCYRGAGLRHRPGAAGARCASGSCGAASSPRAPGQRLRVCERIVDARGAGFTDTSAWYWAAQLASRTGPGKPSPWRVRYENLCPGLFRACCSRLPRWRPARSMPHVRCWRPLPGEWSVPLQWRPVGTASRRAVGDPAGHLALGRPAAGRPRRCPPAPAGCICNGTPPAGPCCCAARPASCSRLGWDRKSLQLAEVQATARRQGELLSGEIVSGRVRGAWQGELAQGQLRLRLSIPATPIADGYALFAANIPELAQRAHRRAVLAAGAAEPALGQPDRRTVDRRLPGGRPGHRGAGRRAQQLRPRPARQPADAPRAGWRAPRSRPRTSASGTTPATT